MTYNNFQYRRKPKIQKGPIIALCVVLAFVIAVATFFIVRHFIGDKEKPENLGKCSWSTEGLGKVSDAKILGGKVIVFTEKKDGKKGLMTLDGKITEKAEHNDFYIRSTEWREEIFVADSPVSDYPLIVDAETAKLTSRQFNKEGTPEKIPVWSVDSDYLYWSGKNVAAVRIKREELKLPKGYYPVADSTSENAKWGYINEYLFLDIALIYSGAEDFSEGFAAVCKDGKWGYIGTDGKEKIPFVYDGIKDIDAEGKDGAFSFENGFVPVNKNGKYGIINSKGETVVNFVFDAIFCGKNGKYVACKNGEWGVITLSDKADPGTAVTTTASQQSSELPVSMGTYIIKTSGSVLNMRKESNTEAEIVAKIPNGTVVEVMKSVSGWAYVKYGRYEGWVNSSFIAKYTPPPATTVSATQTATEPTT